MASVCIVKASRIGSGLLFDHSWPYMFEPCVAVCMNPPVTKPMEVHFHKRYEPYNEAQSEHTMHIIESQRSNVSQIITGNQKKKPSTSMESWEALISPKGHVPDLNYSEVMQHSLLSVSIKTYLRLCNPLTRGHLERRRGMSV